MKIVFFNRFFFPDSSATSQILSDLAFHLAVTGSEVHVVTSHPENEEARTETQSGVIVHRVAAAMTKPHSLMARALAYFRYLAMARRAAKQLLKADDIAVIKTDPPLLSVAIAGVAKAQSAHLVIWLQDLFPEIAIEYGIPGMRWPLGTFLRTIRDRSLSSADAVVAIADKMAARVLESGAVAPGRLRVIHNWADGHAVRPIQAKDNLLRRKWCLMEKFVVGYSGNLGRVHEFETFLGAAAMLRHESDVTFLIIGRGPRLSDVQDCVRQADLTNVLFRPHQARDQLADLLGVPDVHVAILRPEFEGLVQPSKLYGILAAGRPTIFVGDPAGETSAILAKSEAGIAVATGDSRALAEAILRLKSDPSLRLRMGERARCTFEGLYDQRIAMEKWESILDNVASHQP